MLSFGTNHSKAVPYVVYHLRSPVPQLAKPRRKPNRLELETGLLRVAAVLEVSFGASGVGTPSFIEVARLITA